MCHVSRLSVRPTVSQCQSHVAILCPNDMMYYRTVLHLLSYSLMVRHNGDVKILVGFKLRRGTSCSHRNIAPRGFSIRARSLTNG